MGMQDLPESYREVIPLIEAEYKEAHQASQQIAALCESHKFQSVHDQIEALAEGGLSNLLIAEVHWISAGPIDDVPVAWMEAWGTLCELKSHLLDRKALALASKGRPLEAGECFSEAADILDGLPGQEEMQAERLESAAKFFAFGRDRIRAVEYARRALEKDPNLEEAPKIVAQLSAE